MDLNVKIKAVLISLFLAGNGYSYDLNQFKGLPNGFRINSTAISSDEREAETAIPTHEYKKLSSENKTSGIQKKEAFRVIGEFDSSGALRVLTWGWPDLSNPSARNLIRNRLALTGDGKLQYQVQCQSMFLPKIYGPNNYSLSCTTITPSVCQNLTRSSDEDDLNRYTVAAIQNGSESILTLEDQVSYQKNVQPHLQTFSRELKELNRTELMMRLMYEISEPDFKKSLQLVDGNISGRGTPTEYRIENGNVGPKMTYSDAIAMALYLEDQKRMCTQAQKAGVLPATIPANGVNIQIEESIRH